MYQEYLQVGITIRIKHFLQKLPEISKKLKCKHLFNKYIYDSIRNGSRRNALNFNGNNQGFNDG